MMVIAFIILLFFTLQYYIHQASFITYNFKCRSTLISVCMYIYEDRIYMHLQNVKFEKKIDSL